MTDNIDGCVRMSTYEQYTPICIYQEMGEILLNYIVYSGDLTDLYVIKQQSIRKGDNTYG